MKKLIYIVLMITMISACSDHTQTTVDDTLPEYDVIPYCLKFSSQFKKYDIEGVFSASDSTFTDCLKEEKTNYEWLKSHWDLLSSKAKTFCKQAAGDPDEDYNVLKVCAQAVTCKEDNDNLDICIEQKN